MSLEQTSRPWWLEPLPSDVPGLSGAEAKARLARFGPNLFRERQERSLLLQYLTRFKNPLVLILLVASAVSAFTGEVTNFLIISCIVLLSVTLDFVQEYRANAAAEKLRQSVSVRAIVMRDGKPLEVAVIRGGARRCCAAFGRRSDSGGRQSARSARFLRQAGAADR